MLLIEEIIFSCSKIRHKNPFEIDTTVAQNRTTQTNRYSFTYFTERKNNKKISTFNFQFKLHHLQNQLSRQLFCKHVVLFNVTVTIRCTTNHISRNAHNLPVTLPTSTQYHILDTDTVKHFTMTATTLTESFMVFHNYIQTNTKVYNILRSRRSPLLVEQTQLFCYLTAVLSRLHTFPTTLIIIYGIHFSSSSLAWLLLVKFLLL